jgi:NAD(P)-dependent dehydrogenase (short-subunit alcohol dehydrogenase family)
MTSTTPSQPVAVVTGGARGIGLAVARWFLAHGHNVALLDIDAATLAATDAALANAEHVLALHTDVSQPDQVDRAMQAVVARFGRIDALVNNAGVAVFKPHRNTTFDEWKPRAGHQPRRPLPVHAGGRADHAAHGRGGAVVNIASISGLRASTMRVAYGTSKAAVIHLTKQQAIELRRRRHPRQLRGTGPGGHRDGQAGAHRGHPQPTTATRSRWPLRHARRDGRTRWAGCAALRPATSTARRWRPTVASTPAASVCRRCGARAEVRPPI